MLVGNYTNQISEDDIVEEKFLTILQSIQNDSELEEIYLDGNGLTAQCIENLSKIPTLKKLRILSLTANDFFHTDNAQDNQLAIQAIKTIIQNNPNLRIIRIDYNKITDSAIDLLKESPETLKQRMKMILIDLSCNRITEDSIPEAQEILSPESMLYLCNGNWIKNQQLIETTRQAAFQEYQSLETNAFSKLQI
jgi:Leucine-rich repeat (LRR) protein